MQASSPPASIPKAFGASAANIAAIPSASQVGITAGAASLTDGFPPQCFLPAASGGVAPRGVDFNGILNLLSQSVVWQQAGGQYVYSGSYQTAIAGYPQGALVGRSDLSGWWLNLVDQNVTNPETGGAGWIPSGSYSAPQAVALTSAPVTLTYLQAAKGSMVLSGALTANVSVIVPPWAGVEWLVLNQCTGAFTVTIKTPAGTGVVVNTGQTFVFGDGTNILPTSTVPADLASTAAGKGVSLIGWPSGYGVTQAGTNQFFAQNGAAIHRLNDRVFVGGATLSDGAYPQVANDWLSTFYNANGYTGYTLSGQVAVLNNNIYSSTGGILAAAQSKYATSAGSSCIGAYFVGVANNATYNSNAWGIYAEGHAAGVGGIGGNAYACELEVRSKLSTGTSNPYAQGGAIGLQIGAGCGVTATGQFDCNAAIQIVGNPMKFGLGISFQSTSITGTDGVTGTGVAVGMAKGHQLQWYATGGVKTGMIYSDGVTAANSPTLRLSDGALWVLGSTASAQLKVAVADANVNYPVLAGSVATSPVVISAVGTDTNIDLQLVPKGTGKVSVAGFINATNTADTGWTAPTLLNTWANFGAPFVASGYRKIGSMVYMRGTVGGGAIADGTIVCTLPAGFRPTGNRMFLAKAAGAYSRIDVESATGNVIIYNNLGTNAYLSLDSIAFTID